jgi:DNA-binding response OmpR family regulator
MPVTVLIVEDNIELNNSITTILRAENYKTYPVNTIDEAKEAYASNKIDIVLLDIMLGKTSSMQLISYFKGVYDTYILMLTALSDMNSKQIAYSNGCDDYICKPFDLIELTYKIQAISKNLLNARKNFTIGNLGINVKDNCLSCGELPAIYIQPSQMKILQQLAIEFELKSLKRTEHKSHYQVSSQEDKKRVRSTIARLRKSIEEVGCTGVNIEAEYGKGYVLSVVSVRL